MTYASNEWRLNDSSTCSILSIQISSVMDSSYKILAHNKGVSTSV